ncbi:SAM hydrolase/SAM-dependent halogenase family protein [Leptospirillum ferriphilum]|uniref:SAM-dependent chlorinase/fluorinase n=2 Tax=Leptospirillum TaxID=179 RepID=A0A094W8T4_9BACT|nr:MULTISPECIES: SAM-dependent chlorinase/fluorinase [Leptospirillum]EAY57176.1 MAG: conserved protein of unknown function [Leptospirillum rubarum]EDZ38655.1 MAG: Conserved protein of unknown function [Leptospirillum sp. Group II '5-way CG']EIJ77176.1 MAG: uncharacterized protein C75L2_00680025 [Leptospirillum sp. Group II 'C75']AKS23731.1 hypothetical protein ABH19_08225 [Leptospirillum sp. Group II 'CF-1']KGA92920.1 hypothetical protein LptCag_1297 [Leptospirillum ferriphilum]
MRESPLISLATDFGYSDPYVGVLKAVFYSHLKNPRIVDITHNLPLFRPDLALPFLLDSLPWFPPDSYHLVIVDPGVGSERQGILMRGSFGWVVLPDNGLPHQLLKWMGPLEVYLLNKSSFPKENSSPTFQARDFFAPALVRLIQENPLLEFSSPIKTEMLKTIPEQPSGSCLVWNTDHFGNILLGYHVKTPPAEVDILLGGEKIPFVGRYQDIRPGELGILVNSSHWLEIFSREDSAAKRLNVKTGERIPVRIVGGEGRSL